MRNRSVGVFISYCFFVALFVLIVIIRVSLSNSTYQFYDLEKGITQEEIDSIRWDGCHCFAFDPNKLSVDSFALLGLEVRLRSRILSYRKAGGVFKSRSHFGEFCHEDSLWKQHILPLVLFQVDKTKVRCEFNSSSLSRVVSCLGASYYEQSRELIHNRDRIGGFVSWKQVENMHLVSTSFVELCRSFFYIDRTKIEKTDVNTASYSELFHLPYLLKNDIGQIVSYRTRHMGIASFSEFLSCVHDDSQIDLYLRYYMDF
ncbi:helix-hairpin-helix domain-containing protein [Halosquirtibacter laminarini]|uniref:Helix-hairpin-helix domain-containing protein n=1 Tax=Halosquirtibacter laminarini TaxID=3374600 RepID=A0AC61NLK1_9BACT|nr:helix-hairpin-helix domain-containing protein [Prolixibacteraceae bacterium]